MKIVFLAPFGIRPKGTVIARMLPLAVGLQELGHEVVVVAPPYTNPEDSGKTEVVRGVKLRNILLGPKNKMLAVPSLAWRMLTAGLGERPDVIHLFKPKGYGGVAAMVHIGLQQIGLRLPPLFLDTDDWEGDGGMNELHGYSDLEKRFYRVQEQWITRRVAGVTVASRGLEQLVSGMEIPPSRILYLPNGVFDSRRGDGDATRAKLGIPLDAPVVLLYTRFFEFEQAKLHQIFHSIHQRVPNVRFLVVGKGRAGEENLLADAARQQGFFDALVMAGWVEPAELPSYLAAGNVAIYPFADNLVNRTKCPAKLTELLLAENAVVADRVGQLAEYIEDGHSGVLCDPRDFEEMAGKTVELLRDPIQRDRLGRAARSSLLQRFNWNSAARDLDLFYNRLISSLG
ncbi:glycosyltransferase family 4 protein [Geomonas oryzisoli]|uniref:Glycosyltransferase family 4 protein n=1 Tax=Geomonas oryzisoli TaxID=2847992 RepID=A0ABX8JB30_9BACT|nr:glycosyltransferase family 4 protein [Geomonas oryzisoli]QWV92760.1 glycosyltransferase family 4 protein [Geomonas oryzisoli]